MDYLDDNDLLWKLSEGDFAAFECLFLEHQPKLIAFIDKFISDHETARDIASDIFFDVWKKRSSFASVKNFSAYIFKMARYSIYNHYDHQAVVNKYLNERQSLPADESFLGDNLQAAQLERIFMEEIQKMPPRRRQVFMMSRILLLDNEEIASRLKIDKRTVQNQLSLCLQSLRKIVWVILFYLFC